MAVAAETSEGSSLSLADLLDSCPMHAEEPAAHEALEIRGRVERLPDRERFVVLVPRHPDPSLAVLELDVADIESCDVLFEDSSGRKTCCLVLSRGATLRRRYTASALQLELSADPRDEDPADRLPGSADPIAAWEAAAWRNRADAAQSQSTAPFSAAFPPPNELPQPAAAQQSYTPPDPLPVYIESYQGQLYYYFPYGYSGDASSVTGAALGPPAASSLGAMPQQPSYEVPGYGVAAPLGRPCGCAGSAGTPVTHVGPALSDRPSPPRDASRDCSERRG